jgi:hypothetical protein
MENPRTTAARDHDDSALIEDSSAAPAGAGTSGGNLARDVASHDELDSVAEPDSSTGVKKQDKIDEDTARRSNRQR